MAYVGTPLDTTNAFQSLAGKRFNGDGSTTDFTLDSSPNSTLDIEVFVENVRQDPNSAYTVSGTTLAFTGAPPSGTNNIYVVHQAKSVGTIDVPVGSTLDLNGAAELILDADADTTITADTDDQIDIKIAGADDFTFTANTFTAQAGSTITTPTLGVITAKDLGIGVHIREADSSASAADNADALVIENSASVGMSILSGTSNSGNIFFGDSGDNDVGFITYEHNNERMLFGAGGNHTLQVGGSEVVVNNDSDDVDFRIESDVNQYMFMTDASTSMIGFGIQPATYKFRFEGNTSGNYMFYVGNDQESGTAFVQRNRIIGLAADDNTSEFFSCRDSGTNRLVIFSDGDIQNHDNSYGAISDERIKQDITDSGSQWDDIKAVRVRKYKKKDDVRQYGDKAWTEIGVIGQELEAAGMDKLVEEHPPDVDDILSDSAFGTLEDDTENPNKDGSFPKKVKEVKAKVKGVKYSILYMKAIKALQEAQTRIETLETKVKTLEDA